MLHIEQDIVCEIHQDSGPFFYVSKLQGLLLPDKKFLLDNLDDNIMKCSFLVILDFNFLYLQF